MWTTTTHPSRLAVLTGLLSVLSFPGPGAALQGPGGPDGAARRLDRLAEAVPGDPLPPGWRFRTVGGARAPETTIVGGPDGAALRMVADSAAGQAVLELEDGLDPVGGTLSWTWRVDARPGGADLADGARDDSPARLFLVFGGGGILGRPRFLFYTWGDREAVGATFPSHVGERVAVVVVRGGSDPVGVWLTERRDPAADFRRAFGREPDEIRAVGLMADTDQLGGRAVVTVRTIRWEEGP